MPEKVFKTGFLKVELMELNIKDRKLQKMKIFERSENGVSYLKHTKTASKNCA